MKVSLLTCLSTIQNLGNKAQNKNNFTYFLRLKINFQKKKHYIHFLKFAAPLYKFYLYREFIHNHLNSHTQTDPEQLPVGHTHICSVRESNLLHAVQHLISQPLSQMCFRC